MQMRKINLLPPKIITARRLRKRIIKLGLLQAVILLVLLTAVIALFTAEKRVWYNVSEAELVQGTGGETPVERALTAWYESKTCLKWLLSLDISLPQGCEITGLIFSEGEIYITGVGQSVISGEEHRMKLAAYFDSIRSEGLTLLDDGRYSYELRAVPGAGK